MKLFFSFLLMILMACGSKKKNTLVSVRLPDGTKNASRDNIIIKVTGDNRIYIEERELSMGQLDSSIQARVLKQKEQNNDSLTLVIRADTATSYGLVFKIIRQGKKHGLKVVANVE